ncbi:MAG: hypothetical protein ACR2PF_02200 [Rhizobiaceae bacterium]
MMNPHRLAGRDKIAMPNVTFTSDYRPTGFTPPPQFVQFGPDMETMLHDVCSGDHPLVPKDRQGAFVVAVLDEIGRGTHPSKIEARLLESLETQPDISHAA